MLPYQLFNALHGNHDRLSAEHQHEELFTVQRCVVLCLFLALLSLQSKTRALKYFLTMIHFCVVPPAERRSKSTYAGVALQEPYRALVGIGRVIVAAHSLFKCKCLFYSRLHVGVILFRLVVGDETALPQRANSLDALEFFGLFAFIRTDWQLVAPQFTLAPELIEDGILHEIGLHVPLYGYALPDTPFVQIIEPAYHFGHAALADERLDVPKL